MIRRFVDYLETMDDIQLAKHAAATGAGLFVALAVAMTLTGLL